MDKIIICDLEVMFRVGVPEEERALPQRLLLHIELDHDFSAAAQRDDISRTIDYFGVAQRLRELGRERSWKLIETLAVEIAQLLLEEFETLKVSVEVKKFILPETRHVSVRVTRSR